MKYIRFLEEVGEGVVLLMVALVTTIIGRVARPWWSRRICRTFLFAVVVASASATVVSSVASCSSSTQQQASLIRDATVSANAMATTIETLQGVALVLYRTEQEMQIQIAVNNGETKDQAKARVVVVRKLWAPVWDVFTKARVAYSNLVAVLNDKTASGELVQSVVNTMQDCQTSVVNEIGVARARVQGGVQ